MLGDSLETMTDEERKALRNLPARVYYGVNSDEALALRLLGVPRMAAAPLAHALGIKGSEPLNEIRVRLRASDINTWQAALGERGKSYHRVWSIIEGDS
jgi:hypothetical protein